MTRTASRTRKVYSKSAETPHPLAQYSPHLLRNTAAHTHSPRAGELGSHFSRTVLADTVRQSSAASAYLHRSRRRVQGLANDKSSRSQIRERHPSSSGSAEKEKNSMNISNLNLHGRRLLSSSPDHIDENSMGSEGDDKPSLLTSQARIWPRQTTRDDTGRENDKSSGVSSTWVDENVTGGRGDKSDSTSSSDDNDKSSSSSSRATSSNDNNNDSNTSDSDSSSSSSRTRNGNGARATSSSSTNNNDDNRSSSSEGGGRDGARPTSSNSSNGDNNNESRTSSSSDNEGGGGARPTSSSSSSNDDNQSSRSSDSSSDGNGRTSSSASPTSSSSRGEGEGASSSSSSSNSTPSSSEGSTSSSSSSSSNGIGNGSSSASSSSSDASSSTSSGSGGNGGRSSSTSQDSSTGGPMTSTSTNVFVTTVDGQAVTSTRKSVFTSTPGVAGDRSANSNGDNDGYWQDSGAVGGTFAAVGIVVVALILLAGWLLWRRRKSKRMDADVMAAASAAAATTRTPFDDDDEDDIGMQGSYGTPPTGGAPIVAGGSATQTGSLGSGSIDGHRTTTLQPYYQAPGYHQPDHYVQTVDDPYGSVHSNVAAAGVGMGGLAAPSTQYYSPGRVGNSHDIQRGMYESLPTDAAFSYQRPSMDSGAYSGMPTGSSAYAYAQPDPFRDSSQVDLANGPPFAYQNSMGGRSQGSMGQLSAPSVYETGGEQQLVSMPSVPSVPSNMSNPAAAYDDAFSVANNKGFDGGNLAAPSEAVRTGDDANVWPSAPVSYQSPNSASEYVPITGPISSGPREVAEEPTLPLAQSSSSNSGPGGVVQAFGADQEGQSAMDHGDWDPPALSSAWFPVSVQGQNQQMDTTSEAHPFETQTTLPQYSGPSTGVAADHVDAKVSQEGAAAVSSVSPNPQTLMVRNPSPEDEE